MYYRDTQVAILCFDVNNSTSLANLKTWYNDLKQSLLNQPSSPPTSNNTTSIRHSKVIIVICGTKMDIQSTDPSIAQEIPLQVKENVRNAHEFSRDIDSMFFVTSAKNNSGVEEMFTAIAKELIQEQIVNVKTERHTAGGNVIQIIDDEREDVNDNKKVKRKQKSNCCTGDRGHLENANREDEKQK